MRRYVLGHPEYADMGPWSGRETSDIVYDDVQGELTDFLTSRNYLSRDQWADRRPQYFIEVKTTTGACETPFYMSNGQYERVSTAYLE